MLEEEKEKEKEGDGREDEDDREGDSGGRLLDSENENSNMQDFPQQNFQQQNFPQQNGQEQFTNQDDFQLQTQFGDVGYEPQQQQFGPPLQQQQPRQFGPPQQQPITNKSQPTNENGCDCIKCMSGAAIGLGAFGICSFGTACGFMAVVFGAISCCFKGQRNDQNPAYYLIRGLAKAGCAAAIISFLLIPLTFWGGVNIYTSSKIARRKEHRREDYFSQQSKEDYNRERYRFNREQTMAEWDRQQCIHRSADTFRPASEINANFGLCLKLIATRRPEPEMKSAFSSNFYKCLRKRGAEEERRRIDEIGMRELSKPREFAKPMEMDTCLRRVRTTIFKMQARPRRRGRNAAASLPSSRKGNRTSSRDLQNVTDFPDIFLAKKEHFVIDRFDREE